MKKIYLIIALVVSLPLLANPSVPYLAIRSQGVNAVRNLVGWQELINKCYDACDCNNNYGVAALTVEYDQTFWGGKLAQCLLSDDVVSTNERAILQISGSRAANTGPSDWLADYFGLPTDFFSTITFQPKISSIIGDFNFYFGLDRFKKGLYFKIDAPVVHTSWHLNFHEDFVAQGTNNYSAGYFIDTVVPNDQLLTKATDFFTGTATPNLTNADGSKTPFAPLTASKWFGTADGKSCKLTKTRVSDLNFTFGYNFSCTDNHYLGANLQLSVPTGNKPCGEYFFEPVVGNGGHVEVGAGLIGHATLWKDDCVDRTFGFYFDATLTHLFEAHQRRVFDLCNQGTNSRYMLAYKLAPQTNNLAGSLVQKNPVFMPSTFQFSNEYTPVANLTHQNVKVKATVQADVAIKFSYGAPCWNLDVGYNFWGRTHEKIRLSDNCCDTLKQLDGKTWALKGDAQVYGFSGTTPVALAATESSAIIYNGTNLFDFGSSDIVPPNSVAITNPNIDNPEFAYQGTTALTAIPGGSTQTHTSIQPIALAVSDLNLNGTQALSHKIFAHLNYTGNVHNDRWLIFFGIGASAEFGNNNCGPDLDRTAPDITANCETNCTAKCSKKCSVSQWAAWIKTGISFDCIRKTKVPAATPLRTRTPVARPCTVCTHTAPQDLLYNEITDENEIELTSTHSYAPKIVDDEPVMPDIILDDLEIDQPQEMDQALEEELPAELPAETTIFDQGDIDTLTITVPEESVLPEPIEPSASENVPTEQSIPDIAPTVESAPLTVEEPPAPKKLEKDAIPETKSAMISEELSPETQTALDKLLTDMNIPELNDTPSVEEEIKVIADKPLAIENPISPELTEPNFDEL